VRDGFRVAKSVAGKRKRAPNDLVPVVAEMARMGKRLSNMIWQRVRAGYYAFDFVRTLPFADRLGKAVHSWETSHGYGDSPKAKAGWDAQFSDGQWDYMRKEEARYEAIVDGIVRFGAGGSILDVGCGEGILFQHVQASNRPYQRYVGVDISEVAIAKLAHLNDARHQFSQGNGDTYEPAALFDVIVFNESLYYLEEPLLALRRYSTALTSGGVILVSTYTASRRALSILRDARRQFTVVEERETAQGSVSWFCTTLRPG
jgi:2-polyprenyl-3-methyl-5-hydroxy-6-metoxy-1,4-benzoquinol methylase